MALTHSEQLRAARALVGWSQAELAARTGLSVQTIKRLEGGNGPLKKPTYETVLLLIDAFGSVDVEFVPADTAGHGVRFKTPSPRTK